MNKWQRSDLEAMLKILVIAAERSGVHIKDLEGLGAATKHRSYLKHLCSTGLLYLAQRKGKNKFTHLTEEEAYLPLRSAELLIRLAWEADGEQDERRQRELLGAACWAILYREPAWRIFTDIQVALFLGFLYHDYKKDRTVTQDLEEHPMLAAVCVPFFARAKEQTGHSPSDRLDQSAYFLRNEAERKFGLRDFYGTFRQTAEAHGLNFGDWAVSWPRWRSYWLTANQVPVLLTGQLVTAEEDRRVLGALLALENKRDAVVPVETLGWDAGELKLQLMKFWMLGLPLVVHGGELRALRPFEWLDVNPENPTERWLLPEGTAWLAESTAKEWKDELHCAGSRLVLNAPLPPRSYDFDQEVRVRLNNPSRFNFPFPVALLPSAVPGPCYGQSIPDQDFISDSPTKVSRHHPYLFILNLLIDYIRNDRRYEKQEIRIVSSDDDYSVAFGERTAPLGYIMTELLRKLGFEVLPVRSYGSLWQEAQKRSLLPPGETYWAEHYAPKVVYDNEWRKRISKPLRRQVVQYLIEIICSKEGQT